MAFNIFNRNKKNKKIQMRGIQLLDGSQFAEQLGCGFVTLDHNPEVIAGCLRIAQLIASMTIHLMANTKQGDVRIVNELSRKIDIEPNASMTRSTWMTALVMNMMLYGRGNSVVYPNTEDGKLGDLDIIQPGRVSFVALERTNKYQISIDGRIYDPADLLHFVYNPNPDYPFMGQGLTVALKDIAQNLGQAEATKKGFMQSKWKPSIIVKVDGLSDEFASQEGRKKLLEEYIDTNESGQPWFLPAELFEVEQIRPLSLADLAINEAVEIDKRTVASVLGVPPFVLGVGDFNRDAWNAFISNTVRPIAQGIEQELTRKLIISPKMYLTFNASKLYSYDLEMLSNVYGSQFDRGIITGNEVRDVLGHGPLDGLDDLLVLENYIPVKMAGKQSKLEE